MLRRADVDRARRARKILKKHRLDDLHARLCMLCEKHEGEGNGEENHVSVGETSVCLVAEWR